MIDIILFIVLSLLVICLFTYNCIKDYNELFNDDDINRRIEEHLRELERFNKEKEKYEKYCNDYDDFWSQV